MSSFPDFHVDSWTAACDSKPVPSTSLIVGKPLGPRIDAGIFLQEWLFPPQQSHKQNYHIIK